MRNKSSKAERAGIAPSCWTLRKSATINWQNRKSARAKMIAMVKVLLAKYPAMLSDAARDFAQRLVAVGHVHLVSPLVTAAEIRRRAHGRGHRVVAAAGELVDEIAFQHAERFGIDVQHQFVEIAKGSVEPAERTAGILRDVAAPGTETSPRAATCAPDTTF